MFQGQQMCEAKSINFKGICLKWSNCKQVCISECSPDGRCKGFIRECGWAFGYSFGFGSGISDFWRHLNRVLTLYGPPGNTLQQNLMLTWKNRFQT
ncbi:hypothetical protein YC2023_018523 [Brassica napus]